MPIVLITLAIGIALGYWIARMQLKGKFILAEEEMETATWRAVEIEQELQSLKMPHPSPPTLPLPLPLSEQWGLPHCHNQSSSPQPLPLPRPLYDGDNVIWLHPPKNRKEPPQYSAAQIIGDVFYEIPPDYPGGIDAWKDEHPMKGRGK